MAYDLAIRNSKRVPDSWCTQKSDGKDWLKGFKSRHSQLSIRTPEPTSIARATAFNKTNVGPFFDKLKQLYEELSLTPERIYNVDETALSTSQKPQKVVAESRVKQVAQLVSHERGDTITMLGIINAIGNSLPPCLVFPRKQFKPHMIFGAPPGTHGFANPRGWMTKQLFVECLRHIHRHVRSTRENKVLLSTRGCTTIPGKRQTIHDVAGILGAAYSRAFTLDNAISGFRATGICPLNDEVFSEADFYQCYLSDTLCQQPMDTETPTPTSQDATPCSSRTSAADCPADPNAASHCLTEMSSSRAQDAVTINCSPEDIWPHPKATQQRKRTRRALGRNRVLTETPEKAELEAKVRKAKKTLTANKKLATQGKATKKRLFRNE
ncbi:tigger transposable element-derived protein 6-like protein [Plakobranchus ocellatus]|uniref:Tigger transposable element-derived protein 6-like protein n=1 Tax=Plakobranchus ocellatus TaxID=259542 RepID=A0AAV4CXC0_9GAST|nr:tigger transposable element-derived protein 6-like protein [Plakobranchus ocellatus]